MHQPAPTAFVLRPGVVAVLVYAALANVWCIWRLSTYRIPESGGDEVARVLSTRWFLAATGVHAILALVLLGEMLLARRSGVGQRRGQTVGVVLALVLLAGAQWVAVLAHRSIEHP